MQPPHVGCLLTMITRDTFPLRRIWPKTYKRLLVLLVFDCAVAILYTFFDWRWLSIEALPLAQLGSALTIFLAFRANAAYGRWWEARQLWGSLVNTSLIDTTGLLADSGLLSWAEPKPGGKHWEND